ncbi:hypothetical protein CLCR_10185 [Cladophialophora carrionii]|uniref:Uncharacterized protein n=1 Tax=Cladophialophora carrionii TaxID=86049 RepID=A0A1C1CYW4_9EURO|nr:hypothetical protein CLCR_10185 [Cladophialophora carrionii]
MQWTGGEVLIMVEGARSISRNTSSLAASSCPLLGLFHMQTSKNEETGDFERLGDELAVRVTRTADDRHEVSSHEPPTTATRSERSITATDDRHEPRMTATRSHHDEPPMTPSLRVETRETAIGLHNAVCPCGGVVRTTFRFRLVWWERKSSDMKFETERSTAESAANQRQSQQKLNSTWESPSEDRQ